ncbi:MAG: HAMP domain-containing histidine kinase, partial [Myxococcales bacterium]|nr:HAMP domain-containing histidine kinase [Myxococcales bacterium]
MTRSHPDIPTGAGEAKPAGRPSGVAAMLRGGDPGDDEVSAVAHTQRMATIGTLLSSVTHEMNNPLTFVLGNVRAIEELLGGLPPSPEREELTMMAAEARLGCERLVTIVGDLRLLYRSNDEPEPVHVSEVVEQSLRTVRAKIRRRTQCERRVDELPPVLASPTRLSQVLMNLVLNAAEAMPQSRSARDNLVSVDARFEDGEVVIAVSDNGVGIAPGDMPSLFEPFYSKKPLKEGSGLGLYVCRNLVEAMGGRIGLESEEGVGSRFAFTVAARPEPSAVPAF